MPRENNRWFHCELLGIGTFLDWSFDET